MDVIFQLRLRIDDLHRTPAKDVGRPHQHGVANILGNLNGFVTAARNAVFGLLELQLVDQRGKAFPVLGQIDGVGRCAQNRDACRLKRLCKVQRGLPTELHDDALQRAILLLDMQDFQHVFGCQWLEIQTVTGVIIRRHGFRIAVDHDGFIARIRQRKAGVDAAIIELNPLPDAVRTTAQDNDLLTIRGLAFAFGRAKAWGFIGGIHIRRFGFELRGAGIDAFEHGAHAQFVA